MDTTEAAEPSSQAGEPSSAEKKYLTVRQAAFIGVGAMVGTGIFALSVALDYGWKHFHDTRTKNVQLAH